MILTYIFHTANISHRYSAMSTTEKAAAVTVWQNQWSTFLDAVIESYGAK